MAHFEVEERLKAKIKKEKRLKVAKVILLTIAAAGFLAVAVAAPNIMQVVRMFEGKNKYYNRYGRKYYVQNKIGIFERKGLIRREKRRDKTGFVLTDKGRFELLTKFEEGLIKNKKRKWDKNWRIVIYDIWETSRAKRNLLRQTLKRLGFKKLQNSVWISPYDSEELIFLLKTDLALGKGVLYMTVSSLENDHYLRKEFGLK